MSYYITGICNDQYSRPMTTPCNIIVSDIANGELIAFTTSSGNGYFNINFDDLTQKTYVVTFYLQGVYGLDFDIASAQIFTTISGA